MLKYTIKRLILALITAVIVITLTFILMKLLPFSKPIGMATQIQAYYGNQVILGYVIDKPIATDGLGELLYTYKDSLMVEHYYYVKPILEQYWVWVSNILTKWDWGTSNTLRVNATVISIIAQKLPYSVYVNVISVLVSVPLGVFLGVVAALQKNKPADHVISTTVMVFISIPSFVVISFLMLWLCYGAKVLPTQWPTWSDATSSSTIASGFVIPVLALSFGSVCGYTRFTRAELCEVMSSEYLLLARTKGLTKRQSIVRHALRNAMVPIVPSILAEFIGILGGSMILENLYGIPGIGSLYIEALNAKDYNVVFVDMAIYTTIGLLAGVLLDLSYGFIDPRIRMGAKK